MYVVTEYSGWMPGFNVGTGLVLPSSESFARCLRGCGGVLLCARRFLGWDFRGVVGGTDRGIGGRGLAASPSVSHVGRLALLVRSVAIGGSSLDFNQASALRII